MQVLVEYGLGGLALVMGAWVIAVAGHSIREAYRKLNRMRMEARVLEEFMEDQDDDHRNGNGKVA